MTSPSSLQEGHVRPESCWPVVLTLFFLCSTQNCLAYSPFHIPYLLLISTLSRGYGLPRELEERQKHTLTQTHRHTHILTRSLHAHTSTHTTLAACREAPGFWLSTDLYRHMTSQVKGPNLVFEWCLVDLMDHPSGRLLMPLHRGALWPAQSSTVTFATATGWVNFRAGLVLSVTPGYSGLWCFHFQLGLEWKVLGVWKLSWGGLGSFSSFVPTMTHFGLEELWVCACLEIFGQSDYF
jgi:hypothetical protein